jgi:hypothetical protein
MQGREFVKLIGGMAASGAGADRVLKDPRIGQLFQGGAMTETAA